VHAGCARLMVRFPGNVWIGVTKYLVEMRYKRSKPPACGGPPKQIWVQVGTVTWAEGNADRAFPTLFLPPYSRLLSIQFSCLPVMDGAKLDLRNLRFEMVAS
jgi:hypothetical protein